MKKKKALVKTNSSSGFTLIEILIVLGILAAVMALGLGRIRKNENNIKKSLREISVLSREIRNHARLTQSTMRLMIDISEKESKFWVEKGDSSTLRDPKEIFKKDPEPTDDKKKPAFSLYKKLTKKVKPLEKGISFKSLEVENMEALTDGLSAIYYSPEGYVEASILQLTDGKNTWSLIFNPLTGFVDITEEAKTLKDITRQ
ncbi:MAG: prepilin-type N-terminal cleavage/methylation domain-containing protein [Bdellovibrionaceae bacterium]|nr:prepilin-type N-terminal cleavage/methylation domain-containing protein [Pseudobdellovibrionaceae bacterium]NUM57275.1 prepilin-type N-terminal cleavage/methylation domain-containing protein [Pseudobdellovibrionaceae bacterium]